MIASAAIETGDADVVIAGGAESMTRSPWVLMKPDRPFPAGDFTAVSTALGWRLVNGRMPPEWTVSLGESNEQLREQVRHLPRAAGCVRLPLAPTAPPRRWERRLLRRSGHGRSRRRADPRRGHPRRTRTARETRQAQAVVSAGRHRHRRQRLPPQRRSLGAAARLARRQRTDRRLEPVARIAGPRSDGAGTADLRLRAGAKLPRSRLRRAGIAWREVGAVELNEAFAVQSLACIDAWERRSRTS